MLDNRLVMRYYTYIAKNERQINSKGNGNDSNRGTRKILD